MYLKDHPEREKRKQQIIDITNLGMNGSISLRESLERRLDLLACTKAHLEPLIKLLREEVSESFKRNREFFTTHADNIFIISNGFREFIEPIVPIWYKTGNVLRRITIDADGRVTGLMHNPLSSNNGKVEQLEAKPSGDV